MTYQSNKTLAAAGAGLALGIIASRLLAPLMASATGSVRSTFGEDPFQRLMDDHKTILDTLDAMDRTPTESHATRAKLFLVLKRTLAKHALAEEDIVYPLLHHNANGHGAAKHLFEEHADMKIALFDLETRLKNGDDWGARVRSLRHIIAGHIRDEEDVQFPKLREVLATKRAGKLPAEIRREEAMIL